MKKFKKIITPFIAGILAIGIITLIVGGTYVISLHHSKVTSANNAEKPLAETQSVEPVKAQVKVSSQVFHEDCHYLKLSLPADQWEKVLELVAAQEDCSSIIDFYRYMPESMQDVLAGGIKKRVDGRVVVVMTAYCWAERILSTGGASPEDRQEAWDINSYCGPHTSESDPEPSHTCQIYIFTNKAPSDN